MEKQLERLLRTCVALLFVSLVLNVYYGNKVNTMARELQGTNAYTHQWENVQLQLSSLHAAVNDLNESADWATPVTLTIGERQDALIPVYMAWQVKEMPEESTVIMHLKHEDDLEYTSYEGISTGGGGYQVVLEMPYRLNPDLSVTHSYSSSKPRSGDGGQSVEMASRPVGYAEDRYEYYISMSGGGQVRTTKVNWIDLGKVGMSDVGPLHLEIHHDDSNLRVAVSEAPELIGRLRPTKATLRIVQTESSGNGEIETIVPLTPVTTKPAPGDFRKYEGEAKDSPSAVDHYVLVLEYSDGSEVWTVEKVVR